MTRSKRNRKAKAKPDPNPPTPGESLKAIEQMRALGYGPTGVPVVEEKSEARTPTNPKRAKRAGAKNALQSDTHAWLPPVPRPDTVKQREWTFLCAYLDTRNGQKTLAQAGLCVDPKSPQPRSIAWRMLQKPHIKAYIDTVREAEVAALGVTRATIAEVYSDILEQTSGDGARRRSVTKDGEVVELGLDSGLVEARRKAAGDLSQHLGLDKPVKVAVVDADGGDFFASAQQRLLDLAARAREKHGRRDDE